MDQDDPEERIAELERRLAEHQRFAEPKSTVDPRGDPSDRRAGGNVAGTPVGAEGTASRSFVATASRLNMKTLALAAVVVYGGIPAMMALPYAVSAGFHVTTKTAGHWMHWLVLGAYGLLPLLFACSSRMRSFVNPKVSIRVIGGGLEVIRRGGRGEVYPLSSATLGPWATSQTLKGTALHLRNGQHRFVLGGHNHRVPAGVRLDAKPLWKVDAWMPAQDFDALLRTVYR